MFEKPAMQQKTRAPGKFGLHNMESSYSHIVVGNLGEIEIPTPVHVASFCAYLVFLVILGILERKREEREEGGPLGLGILYLKFV